MLDVPMTYPVRAQGFLFRQGTLTVEYDTEPPTLRRPGKDVEGNLSFFLLSVSLSIGRLGHPVSSLSLQVEG